MCIRVQYAPFLPAVPWDHQQKVITLPRHLTEASSLQVVRAILAELAIPQPVFGARCFCGEPITLLAQVPQQRRREVVQHGA
jgi:hypothetical protein